MCNVPPSPVSTPHLFTHTWPKVGVVKGVDEGELRGCGRCGRTSAGQPKTLSPTFNNANLSPVILSTALHL